MSGGAFAESLITVEQGSTTPDVGGGEAQGRELFNIPFKHPPEERHGSGSEMVP